MSLYSGTYSLWEKLAIRFNPDIHAKRGAPQIKYIEGLKMILILWSCWGWIFQLIELNPDKIEFLKLCQPDKKEPESKTQTIARIFGMRMLIG